MDMIEIVMHPDNCRCYFCMQVRMKLMPETPADNSCRAHPNGCMCRDCSTPPALDYKIGDDWSGD